MSKIANWYLAIQRAPTFYWMATAAAVAHPVTRRYGLRMASFGIRASGNMALASSRALLSTPLVTGGTATLASGAASAATYTGALAVGYAAGAVVGTGVSYAIFGEEGASDAVDFYTGQGDYKGYFDFYGNLDRIITG